MRGLTRTWPYGIALVVVFLGPVAFGAVLEATAGATDATTRAAAATGLARFFALIIDPIAVMVASFFAGFRIGPVWAFPLLAALVYLPVGLLQFGAVGAIYAAIMAVFGLLGWFFGSRVHSRQQAD